MLLEVLAFLVGLSFVGLVLLLTVRLSKDRQPGHDPRRTR